ncbi:hypothetical protein EYF80_040790 [Liparis tanakae]|uniref:C2H2-type domain-containing protein n=1 Tax=Liparis tanakae TaxID=230148 RepID=A0A4Z2G628_9TELE|nr:hypothetical protein EYF80_040790 [Liparis tanakae]
MSAAKTLISQKKYFSFRKKIPTKRPYFFSSRKKSRITRKPTMYARTNTGGAHGDFQDRNGVNYVTSTESFGHCSQLFWKKDPNDSGPSSTISWCDQLPAASAALSSSSLSSASLSSSSLSLESRAPPPPLAAATTPDDMESDERPYVCDMCTCAYKHASSLLNHKLTHKIGDFR